MQKTLNFADLLLKRDVQKMVKTFLFTLLFVQAIAQQEFTGEIRKKFETYRKEVLEEKLFVHTDKSFYITGEILWFKLYDVDAFFHLPLSINSVAYVELLDKNNQRMVQAKVALKEGDGNGSIYLPGNLNSGNYKFRAYTNWMKNFSSDYFFEKNISIYNPRTPLSFDSGSSKVLPNIDFFPEGGNLVNGIRSKCAYKVSDQYGNGVDYNGILLNDHGDTILTFSPLKFGMGNFSFTPVTGDSYNAVIRFSNGVKMVKDLPRAYDHGFTMHLEQAAGGQLKVTVRRSADTSAKYPNSVYLFIHTRQSIKWIGSKIIQNSEAIFLVDTSILGDGISQLTVFNNDQAPVCERLYFKYPKTTLQLLINVDRSYYECRKKIGVTIFSGDRDGNPIISDLSLAVFRIDSLQNADQINIENYLLLTADLSGRVESPDYYFRNMGIQTTEAMDNLMLTQGWRRFKWEDVLQNKKPAFEFTPELNGHLISGRITRSASGLPGIDIDCYLSVPGYYTKFRNAISDNRGNIKFQMKNFYGSKEIIVQTNSAVDSGYLLDIASPFSDQFSAISVPPFSIPEKNFNNLIYSSINSEAQDLFIADKLQQFNTAGSDTAAFYGDPDERYLLDNYTRFTTMEEILREYVKAVNISKKEGRYELSVIDESTKLKFDGNPLVLLDGVPVFDIDKFIKDYDPLKINKLEVLRRQYFLGYKSFDGIINFTTYSGDLAGFEMDPNTVVLDYEGLEMQRKFYAPRYENERQVNGHLPDFRNLIYWAPELKTNAKGKVELDFYSSDIPGTYVIMLQGLSKNGLPGSEEIFFEVKGKSK
jgi:hypothetical protein